MNKILAHNGDVQAIEVNELPKTAQKIAPEPLPMERSQDISIL